MEDKYFIPDINDIRLGDEFQLFKGIDESNGEEVWIDYELNAESAIIYYEKLKAGDVRIPFLTREQIESEGWIWGDQGELLNKYSDVEYEFSENKSKRLRVYSSSSIVPGPNHIRIFQRSIIGGIGVTLFEGECKCINTLRYIQKLLGLK